MLDIRNILKTSMANLFAGGFSFLQSLVVARLLSPIDNGHYAQFVLIFNLFFMLFNFGLGNAISYFISKGTWSLPKAIRLSQSMTAVGLFAACLVFAFFYCSSYGLTLLKALNLPLDILCVGLLGGAVFLMVTMFSFIILGQQHYDQYNAFTLYKGLFPLLLIFVSCWWIKSAVVFSVCTLLGMLITQVWICFQLKTSERAFSEPNKDQAGFFSKDLWFYSLPSYVSNLLHYVAIRSLAFSLSYYYPVSYVGYFLVSLVLLESVLILPGSMGQILFPKSSGHEFDTHTLGFWLRISLMIAGVTGGLVYFFSNGLVTWLFGSDYMPVAQAFSALAPSVLLMSVPKMLSKVLSGRWEHHYPCYAAVASAVVSLYMSLFQLPSNGLMAAIHAVNIISAITAVVTFWGYVNYCDASIKDLLPRVSDIKTLLCLMRPNPRVER